MSVTASAIAVLLFSVAVSPLHAASKLEESLKDLAEGVTAEAVKAKKHRVAIMDFTTGQGAVTAPGQFLAEELATHLLLAGELKIIDRKSLTANVKRYKLTQLDPAQAKMAQAVAKAVRADVFVTGTYIETPEGLQITAKLLSPTTMHVIGATRRMIPKTGHLADLMKPPDSPKPAKADEAKPAALPAGLGSASNEFYQLTVTAIQRQERQIKLDLALENKTPRGLKILCKLQETYLEDEQGSQWRQEAADSREGLCTRGLELSPQEKERAVLTFIAKDKTAGSVFTLRFHEATPHRDAIMVISGLQSESIAAPSDTAQSETASAPTH